MKDDADAILPCSVLGADDRTLKRASRAFRKKLSIPTGGEMLAM